VIVLVRQSQGKKHLQMRAAGRTAAPSPPRTRGMPRPRSPGRTPRAGSWRWCPARDVAAAPALTLDCWPRAGRHGRGGRTACRRRSRRCLRPGGDWL